MAGDYNHVGVVGNLTKDPELRYTTTGKSVASFSIANNQYYKVGDEKKQTTSFFNCTAWGKLGEVIVEYMTKGKKMLVAGRLQQRSWEDQNGNKRYAVEIVVNECQFLSPKDSGYGGGSSNNQQGDSSGEGSQASFDDNPFSDNDIPF